ncbi:hypothetical protein [Bacillus sp. FSL K6-3431]|uniref:hypothetical protein n=1 Tax=Bacillus sp. FSL K6-3431 TaxID=2921500 RepID=UPI0030F5A1A3
MFWKKKEQVNTEGFAWFSYTVMLPDTEDGENEVTVIGNLTIKNTGNVVLNDPRICMRIKPPQGVHLGGKIGSATHTALSIDGTNTEAWHYFQDNWKETTKETGEHWLKPNYCRQLQPNDNLTFANELRISLTQEKKHVIVEGFFYCEEIKNGFSTLNNIMINL